MKRTTLLVAVLTMLLGGVAQARADLITYTLKTTASGTIDGMTETNALLTMTVTYDTSLVQGAGGIQVVNNQSVAVMFGGITDTVTTATVTDLHANGTFDINTPTGDVSKVLLGVGLGSNEIQSLTSLPSGPFTDFSDPSGTTYNTTGGSITVTSASNVTFTSAPADAPTPEPSSLSLLGIGTVALIGYGWRRRKLAAA